MHGLLSFSFIQADTTRVIWSWNSFNPSDVLGEIRQHQSRGTTSLNLLGGLNNERPNPPDTKSFTIRNTNVSISVYIQVSYHTNRVFNLVKDPILSPTFMHTHR